MVVKGRIKWNECNKKNQTVALDLSSCIYLFFVLCMCLCNISLRLCKYVHACLHRLYMCVNWYECMLDCMRMDVYVADTMNSI